MLLGGLFEICSIVSSSSSSLSIFNGDCLLPFLDDMMGASFFFADFFAGDFSHTLLSKDARCEINYKAKLLPTPTNLPVWYFRPRLDVKTLEHFGHVRFEPSSMSSFLLPLASSFDAEDA